MKITSNQEHQHEWIERSGQFLCLGCGTFRYPVSQSDNRIYRTKADATPWISVNDRLPPIGDYLVTYIKRGWNLAPFEPRVYAAWFNGKEFMDDDCREFTVTHWQPLPPPPEPRDGRTP